MAANDRQLLILSGSFFLLFLAFSTTQSLESSLQSGSVGTMALGTVYIVLTLSSLAAPRLLQAVGVTRGLTGGATTYVLFIISNLYFEWYTLIPAAVILGFGAAVLWSAQGVYISALAPTEELAARASGIFFAIFQSSQLFGNLLAFFVLRSGGGTGGGGEVAQSTVNLLFSIFAISACAGTVLSSTLASVESLATARPGGADRADSPLGAGEVDQHDSEATQSLTEAQDHAGQVPPGAARLGEEDEPGAAPQAEAYVVRGEPPTMATVLVRERTLLFLLPLFFFNGMEAAFAWSDFTAEVIKPLLGEAYVPLVMMVFGGSNALSSALLGKAGGKGPRSTRNLLVLGSLLQVIAVLLIWTGVVGESLASTGQRWFALLVVALVFGFADACLNTLTTALLAARFRSRHEHTVKLAFAHFKFWQSLATGAAFFYSAHVALPAKCAITIGSGVLGLAGLVSSGV